MVQFILAISSKSRMAIKVLLIFSGWQNLWLSICDGK